MGNSNDSIKNKNNHKNPFIPIPITHCSSVGLLQLDRLPLVGAWILPHQHPSLPITRNDAVSLGPPINRQHLHHHHTPSQHNNEITCNGAHAKQNTQIMCDWSLGEIKSNVCWIGECVLGNETHTTTKPTQPKKQKKIARAHKRNHKSRWWAVGKGECAWEMVEGDNNQTHQQNNQTKQSKTHKQNKNIQHTNPTQQRNIQITSEHTSPPKPLPTQNAKQKRLKCVANLNKPKPTNNQTNKQGPNNTHPHSTHSLVVDHLWCGGEGTLLQIPYFDRFVV